MVRGALTVGSVTRVPPSPSRATTGKRQQPPLWPGWTLMPRLSPVCPLQRHPNALSFRCSLADFQIEKKIGRGQFSEVYKATCLLDRKTVALKKVQVSQRLRGFKATVQERLLCLNIVAPGQCLSLLPSLHFL